MDDQKYAFRGSKAECQVFLSSVSGPYVYILNRPDGRPFYVGKGNKSRVLDHENEARHENSFKSNAHKLNIIRSINAAGQSLIYEIAGLHEDDSAAYTHEAQLIEQFKRLHEGGPLTNLAPGGGSVLGLSPISKSKHSNTLAGTPDDNPERAILNQFVLSIQQMKSVPIKPVSQFAPRKTIPHPSPRNYSARQAVALAAAASANGVVMVGPCEIPRKVEVEGVKGYVENGVSCDIAKSNLASVIAASTPVDEVFVLNAQQARSVIGFIGQRKAIDLGLIRSEILRV